MYRLKELCIIPSNYRSINGYKTEYKDFKHATIDHTKNEGEKIVAYSPSHKKLAYYEIKNDITKNSKHQIVGYGNLITNYFILDLKNK